MTTHVMTHERPTGRQATTAVAARNGMAGGLPTGANDIVHSRVLHRSVERLTVKYGRDLKPGIIRRTVHTAYRELRASARLKTFLPVTAVRLAENRLRELARETRKAEEARADRTTSEPTRPDATGDGSGDAPEAREAREPAAA